MWRPRTLLITDRARLRDATGEDGDAAMVTYVAAAAALGVDAVQVRDRTAADRHLRGLVGAIVEAVAAHRCRVLVNERAHVAWAAGADGVHLRGDGVAAGRLREAWPSRQTIGRSVHRGDGPEAAAAVDYVVFGTVFASASKGPDAPLAGLPALAAWAATSPVPVLAVGGIDLDRCAAVRRAGAAGIAAIDLFARAYAAGADRLAATVREVHAVFNDGEQTP
jgi:thiamine-phosphate pyrophosphorylase